MPRSKDKPKEPVDFMHGKANGNLTLKQRAFVKELVKTKNGTQAIINAGYNVKSRAVAGTVAVDNLQKPNVKMALMAELDRVGLTESRTAELLEEAIVSGVGRDSRNSDALRGLDMLNKLRGSYAPKQVENRTMSINIEAKEGSELQELMREQLERLKHLTGDIQ